MSRPDRCIDRALTIRATVEALWPAISTADGLEAWLGGEVEIDPRPGRPVLVRWPDRSTSRGLVERVEAPRRFVFRWRRIAGAGLNSSSATPRGSRSRCHRSATGQPVSTSWSRPPRCRRVRSRWARAGRHRGGARRDPRPRRPGLLRVVRSHAPVRDRLPVRRRADDARAAREGPPRHPSGGGEASRGARAGRPRECERRRAQSHVPAHAGPLTEAMGWMIDVGADWDSRLESLRRYVEP